MRVLLRQVNTTLFYVGPGQWSREMKTAKDFGSLANAQQCAAQENLKDVEVVLLNQHPYWEAVWPLNKPDAIPPE